MYIFPCFKLLSISPPTQLLINEIEKDSYLDKMGEEFKNIGSKYELYIKNNTMSKNEIYKHIYEDINNYLDDLVNRYNSFKMCNLYLWHDNTIRIHICKNKCSVHGSKLGNSYDEPDNYDKKDIMNITSKILNSIINSEEYYDDKFTGDIFLVFIDIIIRNSPTFIIYPDMYNDDEDDYDEDDDVF